MNFEKRNFATRNHLRNQSSIIQDKPRLLELNYLLEKSDALSRKVGASSLHTYKRFSLIN